jgi:hypothetical protein
VVLQKFLRHSEWRLYICWNISILH